MHALEKVFATSYMKIWSDMYYSLNELVMKEVCDLVEWVIDIIYLD